MFHLRHIPLLNLKGLTRNRVQLCTYLFFCFYFSKLAVFVKFLQTFYSTKSKGSTLQVSKHFELKV